jgi:hypothetical protein
MSLRPWIVALLVLAAPSAAAEDVGWPVEIDAGEGWMVTLYQPQVDSFEDNDLGARAAVSVVGPDVPEPVFGAVWIVARLAVDRTLRVVRVESVEVPQVRFPEASEEGKERLAKLLEREIPTWDIEISLDRFLADLEVFEERMSVDGLNHDPPTILFATEPTALVTIDGEPKLLDIPGQVGQAFKVQYVVNSPFPLMYDPRGELFYLYGGEVWFSAREATGPWHITGSIPSTVRHLAPKDESEKPSKKRGSGPVPKVIVATEATELIVSAGEPEWSAIEGLDLCCRVGGTGVSLSQDLGASSRRMSCRRSLQRFRPTLEWEMSESTSPAPRRHRRRCWTHRFPRPRR